MPFALGKLSGSTDGKPIAVAATATPGTLIHTAQASVTFFDEIELTASNIDGVDRELTVEDGGVTAAEQQKYTVPAKSTIPLGSFLLRNSLVLRAFAAAANVINIRGSTNIQS